MWDVTSSLSHHEAPELQNILSNLIEPGFLSPEKQPYHTRTTKEFLNLGLKTCPADSTLESVLRVSSASSKHLNVCALQFWLG
jgi:hypothetical protein